MLTSLICIAMALKNGTLPNGIFEIKYKKERAAEKEESSINKEEKQKEKNE